MSLAALPDRLGRLLDRIGIWPVVGLGLGLRLLVLAVYPDPDFPDARAYVTAGRDLMTTGLQGDDIYMPLYPILTWLTGGGLGTRLMDCLVSALTLWLIHALALELTGNRRCALLAALAGVVYPHFLFYAVVGLTETLFLFLLLSAFLALTRRRYALGSAFLVLGILTRPALDSLAPLLVLAFAVVVHRERRVPLLLGRLAVYALVYVVLMAPWWVHQVNKYGAFVRLNLGMGVVLLSGNNPLNQTGGGVERDDGSMDMDLTAYLQLPPLERNQKMVDAAVDWILANPDRFVELAAIKFVRFWQPWPFAPEYRSPAIIAVSLLSYGPFLVLSLAFLALGLREHWRRLTPILLLIAYLTAVHMVLIASIRYRLPLEPFLLIMGAQMLAPLVGAGRPWRGVSRE